jgi:hypothetical protein
VDWFSWIKRVPAANSYEHVNESLDSIKERGIAEQLNDYQLRDKNSDP